MSGRRVDGYEVRYRLDSPRTYSALAMTPDGAYVIGLGDPTTDELSTFSNLGPTVGFHDARDGRVPLILRQAGFVASFLVPEPDPEPT